jgi:hypothetical protein
MSRRARRMATGSPCDRAALAMMVVLALLVLLVLLPVDSRAAVASVDVPQAAPAVPQGNADAVVDSAETEALLIADTLPREPGLRHDARQRGAATVELGIGQDRDLLGTRHRQARVVFDLRHEARLGETLRWVFSDRLDLQRGDHPVTGAVDTRTINALREAYVAWQPDPSHTFNAGRRVWREGVAPFDNPTDMTRAGAFRAVARVNPFDVDALRLGTFGFGYQRVWHGGAMSLMHAPRLARTRDEGDFAIDAGATNDASRWLLSFSQRLIDGVTPQIVGLAQRGQGPRWGVNLAFVAVPSTVVHVEVAQERERLLPPSTGALQDKPARARWCLGLTHTLNASSNVWATVHGNDAAPDRDDWSRFVATSSPLGWAEFHARADLAQQIPARRALTIGASWRGQAGLPIQLSGFVVAERVTASEAYWLELKWLGERADVIVQANVHRGGDLSILGSAPQRDVLSLAVRIPWR